MIKKYTVFIFAILIFGAVSSFAQDPAEFTQREKTAGITQMKAAAAKLNKDMTLGEAEEILGEPAYKNKVSIAYRFEGGESLVLNSRRSNGKTWILADNKSGIDLLQTGYSASIFDFPIFIDGKELLILNQVLELRSDYLYKGHIYFSAQDIENIFGTKFRWDKENLKLKDTESKYLTKVIDVPVFIDDKELLISNPIVFFNDTVYFHLEEMSERFKIKMLYNRHSNLKPTNTFDAKYKAIVTDSPIFIDGNEFLTFNPIVTINNKIYLPADEFEEKFGIKVRYHEKNKLLEIKTGVKDGFKPTKNYDALKKFKEYILKLRDGIEIDGGIESVLGEHYYTFNDSFYMNSIPEINTFTMHYRHKDLGYFYVVQHINKIIFNENGINLSATEFDAETVDFPSFINGEEIVISSPLITLGNSTVYIPIVDFAEILGVKVDWNEEKTELNITTKQEKK